MKIGRAWEQDDTVRWLENGYWLFLGSSFKWPALVMVALALWLLRYWRVRVVTRRWNALIEEARSKGYMGGSQP